jgi:hypothetical protein
MDVKRLRFLLLLVSAVCAPLTSDSVNFCQRWLSFLEQNVLNRMFLNLLNLFESFKNSYVVCSPIRMVVVMMASATDAVRWVAVATGSSSSAPWWVGGAGAVLGSGTGSAASMRFWLLLCWWFLRGCGESSPHWRDESPPKEAVS